MRITFFLLMRLLRRVHELKREIRDMALDQTKMNASLANLDAKSDAIIAALAAAPTSAADQATFDAAAAHVDAVSVKLDAAVNPPVV